MSTKAARLARIFMRRTYSIYRHQRERARAAGVTLDYTVQNVRDLVRPRLGESCPFCDKPLDARSFTLDHDEPTSRGGGHELANLVVCCLRCNETKGLLAGAEFNQLLLAVSAFPDDARRNVLARLRAGGRYFVS